MAIFGIQNPGQEVAQANQSNNGGSREILESAYHCKLIEMAPGKSQAGEDKWTIKWELIGAEEPEAQKTSVGAKKTQHFVVGSNNADSRARYIRDFLLVLKVCGIDVDKLEHDGDLFMAGKTLEAEKPIVCFYLKSQESNPKYLNWYCKGKVSSDLSSVVDIEGVELSKWGQKEGGESQPAVTQTPEPTTDSADLGL